MPSKMENFGFSLRRTFASTKAQQKSLPFVPATCFVIDPAWPAGTTYEFRPPADTEPQEHLLPTTEGRDARSICFTLIRNGRVSKLDHAACPGEELTKAELNVRHQFDDLQDGA